MNSDRRARQRVESGRFGRGWGGVRKWVAALATLAIITGSFVGLSAGVASAATHSFTMTMTAGQFGVHNNAPATFPPPGSLAGSENPATGVISGATISLSPYHTTNTGSTETIFISQTTPGSATGSINSTGVVTIIDTLSVLVTIHSPITTPCHSSTSAHVVLQSSAPYDTSTHVVTISAANFTIPKFVGRTTGGHCGLATTELNSRFAGTINEMSLTVQGTLVLPPPPATPTTTTLTPSPATPVLQGTTVTLHATVASGGQTAKTATGTIKFMVGSTQIGTLQGLATGTASVSTSTLPTVAGQTLTAVYSGDTKYAASTSTPQVYTVQPKPAVGLSTTALTATRGSSTPTTFSVLVTNPATGESFTNLQLQLQWSGISALSGSQMNLSYQNPTGTWCPMTPTGRYRIFATFKGSSGACSSATLFSLAAGHSETVNFEVSYAATANPGIQTFIVSLQTVSGTTIVPPFTTKTGTFTTTPANAPFAKGAFTVVPATKYPVTVQRQPAVDSAPGLRPAGAPHHHTAQNTDLHNNNKHNLHAVSDGDSDIHRRRAHRPWR